MKVKDKKYAIRGWNYDEIERKWVTFTRNQNLKS
jgi:hypothetical protein